MVVGVEDGEARRKAEHLGVAPEDTRADAVERARPERASRRSSQGDAAVRQLSRSFVGEGDCEDLVRPGLARGEESGDPVGQRARFTAAGGGKNEKRPVAMLDGFALARIE